jgi:hypothetical protein
MEHGAVVKGLAGFGSFREADKILDRFGRLIGEQLDLETAFGGIEDGVDFL